MSHTDFQFDIFRNHCAFISLMVSHIICAVKLNKCSQKHITCPAVCEIRKKEL